MGTLRSADSQPVDQEVDSTGGNSQGDSDWPSTHPMVSVGLARPSAVTDRFASLEHN